MAKPHSGSGSWNVMKPMRIRNSEVPCVEVFRMRIMTIKIIVFTTLMLMYSVNPAPSPPNWISYLASDKLHILNQRLQACLSSYLRVASTCPICRKPLTTSWLLIDFRPASSHKCVWTPPALFAVSRLKLADCWLILGLPLLISACELNLPHLPEATKPTYTHPFKSRA
jgi:hypothetical protein